MNLLSTYTLSLLLFIICCLLSQGFGDSTTDDASDSRPHVVLQQGKVIGSVQNATNGRPYDAYFGIPFGRVPGRFLPPQPAGPFADEFVASRKSVYCAQYIGMKGVTVAGVEDCLILNVYVPKIADGNGKLPVMVFIHGGAFVLGSSTALMYGAAHIMMHDVILVTINYRVGVFGFIATEDSNSPGNYGLLDQVLGLQWVQDNIEKFGGNKRKVTIFGESAGAASVIYHLLSPLSSGLFHQAIAMSGSALCPWAIDSKPLKTAKAIAEFVNCPPTDDTAQLVECLRNAELEPLAKAAAVNWLELGPVIEPTCSGRFLTEHPYRLLSEGRFNKVPLITGTTRDEYALFYESRNKEFRVTKDVLFDSQLKMFEEILDEDFPKTVENDISLLMNAYFGDLDFNNQTAVDMTAIQILTDGTFGSCNDITASLVRAQGLPVYSYLFDFASPITSPTNFTGKSDVSHGSDLAYMFDMKMLFAGKKYTPEAAEFVKSFTQLWTNFATFSDPTPSGPLQWDSLTSSANDQYMHIASPLAIRDSESNIKLDMWIDLLIRFMRFQINRSN